MSDGKSLQQRLATEFPQSRPQLLEFPSGAFMIDLTIGGQNYVIEYIVGQGYGLSAQKNATFGWEGVEQAFDTVEELEAGVRQMIEAPR